jgi:hypothetical protein
MPFGPRSPSAQTYSALLGPDALAVARGTTRPARCKQHTVAQKVEVVDCETLNSFRRAARRYSINGMYVARYDRVIALGGITA